MNITSSTRHRGPCYLCSIQLLHELHILLHGGDHDPCDRVLGASRGDGQSERVNNYAIQEMWNALHKARTMNVGEVELDARLAVHYGS